MLLLAPFGRSAAIIIVIIIIIIMPFLIPIKMLERTTKKKAINILKDTQGGFYLE